MSFSQDIRATGSFNRQFGKEKRRIGLSEIPKSDIDTLQKHVIDLRTQVHFLDAVNTIDNTHTIPIGPNDYIFEPDYNTVKIRTKFRDINGIGNYDSHSLNAVIYDSLELYDQAGTSAQIWYSIPAAGFENYPANPELLWKWSNGGIELNIGTNTKQMIYLSNLGTDFDFAANNISLGFWFYITQLPTSGNKAILAYRYQDASNQWSVEIDGTDAKLFTIMKDTGVQTKREYSTAIAINTWYFYDLSWTESGATLTTKINNLADTTSTKTTGTTATTNNLFFGSYPGATTAKDMKGYITNLTYYKTTAINSTQMTSLYTYNTISATTEPFIYGFGQYG